MKIICLLVSKLHYKSAKNDDIEFRGITKINSIKRC